MSKEFVARTGLLIKGISQSIGTYSLYYNSSTGVVTYGTASTGAIPTLQQVLTSGNTASNYIRLSVDTASYMGGFSRVLDLRSSNYPSLSLQETSSGTDYGWMMGMDNSRNIRFAPFVTSYDEKIVFGTDYVIKGISIQNNYSGAGINLSNTISGGKNWALFSTGNGYVSPLGSFAIYGGDIGYAFLLTKEGKALIYDLAGSGNRMVYTDANGILGATAIPSTGSSLSGLTSSYLSKNISSTNIGNSNIYEDNNGNIAIGNGGTVSNGYRLDVNGNIAFGGILNVKTSTDFILNINGTQQARIYPANGIWLGQGITGDTSGISLGLLSVVGFLGISIGYGASTGNQSISIGREAKSNVASFAGGYHAEALSNYSLALNAGSKTSNDYSVVINDGYSYDNLGTYVTSENTRQMKLVFLNGVKFNSLNGTNVGYIGNTVSFSTLSGSGNRMVYTDANGIIGATALPTSGSVISGLTSSYITKNISSTNIGNSNIYEDNNGNVSIANGGTVSNGYRLDVNGNINIASVINTRTGTDLIFKMNGVRVGIVNLGSYNTTFGYSSGSNNTGAYNTFMGHNAGLGGVTSVGSAAVGIGYNALSALTSGDYNVAFGYQAGQSVTTGSYNVAFGSRSLLSTTTGVNNIAIGGNALLSNITGSSNVSIGVGSLQNATNNSNTAIGSSALSGVTTGANNIGIGFQPGQSLTSGSNNIVIGYQQELASNTGSNQLNIGGLIFGIGMSGTVGSPAGQVGILTNAPTSGYALDVNGVIKGVRVNFGSGNTFNGTNNHIIGEGSTITSGASYTSMFGGYSNTIGSSAYISGIFGGSGNGNNATNSYLFGNAGQIVGGSNNHIFGGGASVIFSGTGNTILNSGAAGSYVDYSKNNNIIIGPNAYAQHHGNLMLKDATAGSYFTSTIDNQLAASFVGGYRFNLAYNVNAMFIDTVGAVGINNSLPDSSALLDVTSTTKGVLLPRLTDTQINAISTPATGLTLYSITSNQLRTYNGINWIGAIITSASASLSLMHGNDYVFSGTSATWTLPAISSTVIGRKNIITIKNIGSGTLTINSNAGGNDIFEASTSSSLLLSTGDAYTLLPNGTYFIVE